MSVQWWGRLGREVTSETSSAVREEGRDVWLVVRVKCSHF